MMLEQLGIHMRKMDLDTHEEVSNIIYHLV